MNTASITTDVQYAIAQLRRVTSSRIDMRASDLCGATQRATDALERVLDALQATEADSLARLAFMVAQNPTTPNLADLLAASRRELGVQATTWEKWKSTTWAEPDADDEDDNGCLECARSRGPGYDGPCEH